jgi:protoheme IX farnesyltransferase
MDLASNIAQENARSNEASIGDYWELLKPRVMSLVVFTAIVGLILAPETLPLAKAVVAILCIAIGAGASGALNQWYDADIDAVMARTAKRPIPMGRISRDAAAEFGAVLAVFSVFTMAVLVDYLAAGLLAFTIFFYVVVYTMWLKRTTPQNIVVGGAAGALPPVIAWAAATGATDVLPCLLFAIVFMWTPAHFWALALVKHDDYRRAGVPMLPVIAGPTATKRQIVLYACLTAIAALTPAVLGFAGVVYGTASIVLSAVFVAMAVRLWRTHGRDQERREGLRLFAFSIFYLFMIFAVIAFERLILSAGALQS